MTYNEVIAAQEEMKMTFENMAAAQRAYDRQEPVFEPAHEEMPVLTGEDIEGFIRWMLDEDKQDMLEKVCATLAKSNVRFVRFEQLFEDEILQYLKR